MSSRTLPHDDTALTSLAHLEHILGHKTVCLQTFLRICADISLVCLLLPHHDQTLTHRFVSISQKEDRPISDFAGIKKLVLDLLEEAAVQIIQNKIPGLLDLLHRYRETESLSRTMFLAFLCNASCQTDCIYPRQPEGQFQKYLVNMFYRNHAIRTVKVSHIRAYLENLNTETLMNINPQTLLDKRYSTECFERQWSYLSNILGDGWMDLVNCVEKVSDRDEQAKYQLLHQIYICVKKYAGQVSQKGNINCNVKDLTSKTKLFCAQTSTTLQSYPSSQKILPSPQTEIAKPDYHPTLSSIYEQDICRVKQDLMSAIERTEDLEHKLEQSQAQYAQLLNQCNQYAEQLSQLRSKLKYLESALKQESADKQLEKMAREQLSLDLERVMSSQTGQQQLLQQEINKQQRSNECLRREIEQLTQSLRQRDASQYPSHISVGSGIIADVLKSHISRQQVKCSLKSEVGSKIYDELHYHDSHINSNLGKPITVPQDEEILSNYFDKSSTPRGVTQSPSLESQEPDQNVSSLPSDSVIIENNDTPCAGEATIAIQFVPQVYSCTALDLTNYHNPSYREITITRSMMMISLQQLPNSPQDSQTIVFGKGATIVSLVKQNKNWVLIKSGSSQHFVELFDRDAFAQNLVLLSSFGSTKQNVDLRKNVPLSQIFFKRNKTTHKMIKGDCLPRQLLSPSRFVLANCLYSSVAFLKEQGIIRPRYKRYFSVLCNPYILFFEDIDLAKICQVVPVLGDSIVHKYEERKSSTDSLYELGLGYEGLSSKGQVLGFRTKMVRDIWYRGLNYLKSNLLNAQKSKGILINATTITTTNI